ncbi:MAG TPA: alpha/beta hydrolase [Gemmatimonadaceae bacterium]|jgi:pimeloyl-ACP methyl ester carboxylesterase|nr:alpha/beta hydrolase [Gemmatimonadaceae bacterium]
MSTSDKQPTIVLVHGAWADGTSWQHVIPLLERDDYTVIAVQIALESLADDVAVTKRVIRAQPGPVVVAGHSYGGMVMTSAAAGEPNVQALVYISAFAPDAGESIAAVSANFAPTPAVAAGVPDAAGYLYLDRAKFHDVFCADVSDAEAAVMNAVQKPLNSAIFGATLDAAAWKSIPSWFLVSQEDRAINPDQERFYAKRMNAKTIEVKSSHVSLVSHPVEVTKLIEEAAEHAAAGAMAQA